MTEEQFAAYRTAKSTRPAWANALIVAAAIFATAVLMTFIAGTGAVWFYGATAIALLVAGVLALTGLRRGA